MINPFYEKLAKLAINYSTDIKKGDRVLISGPSLAKDLFQALYIEIIISGGHPFLFVGIEGIQELKYKYASEEQLQFVDPLLKMTIKEFNAYIEIDAEYNTRKLSLVDSKLISKSKGSPANREIWEILMNRIGAKELKYLALPFPCNSLAQEADMDLFSYFKFIEKALYLDKEDPVSEWRKIQKNQDQIVEFLNNVKNIQVIGEDTELSLSTENILPTLQRVRCHLTVKGVILDWISPAYFAELNLCFNKAFAVGAFYSSVVREYF